MPTRGQPRPAEPQLTGWGFFIALTGLAGIFATGSWVAVWWTLVGVVLVCMGIVKEEA